MAFTEKIKKFNAKEALNSGTKVIVTDKYLNQFEEVFENGEYVKKFIGNKRGALTKEEQSYYLDRKLQKVIDNLFISSRDAAEDLNILTKEGITHILNVSTGVDCLFPNNFIYHRKEFPDLPDAPLIDYLDEFMKFIDDAMKTNGNVLVHCNQGKSRSASVIIAYLMYSKKISFTEAFNITFQARPLIDPNYGFIQQLQTYEKKLSSPSQKQELGSDESH